MVVRDLTFFQLEILKELKFSPKYGLELMKNLNVSSGRLYPNLKRLESLGLIEGVKKDNRIYYSLSEKGIQEFGNIFTWISDCVLSIGINFLDDYLNFIIDSLELKEGEKVFVASKRIRHPFFIHIGLELIKRISKKVTISGRVFVLQKMDLPYVTTVESFDLLPDKIVDKSCFFAVDLDEKIIKNCERITNSEISIIGKLYSDFFIEKCFQNILDKISPEIKSEIKPPFIVRKGFKKEELLEKLREYGYENARFSTWGGVFVASIILQ